LVVYVKIVEISTFAVIVQMVVKVSFVVFVHLFGIDSSIMFVKLGKVVS
jgi:hypothetical protein